MGATVAGGAPLEAAGADGRHAISNPRLPTPPRPRSRKKPRREFLLSINTPETSLELLPSSAGEAWIERSAQSVANKVECEHGQENRRSGSHANPGRDLQVLGAGAQHRPPARRWRLHADSEK